MRQSCPDRRRAKPESRGSPAGFTVAAPPRAACNGRMDAQAEYNNRARVPEHPAIIAGWARDAAAFRAGWTMAELGPALWPGRAGKAGPVPARPRRCLAVAMFIHGGYWQALDRRFFSHCARGLLARGRGGGDARPTTSARRCRWRGSSSRCAPRPRCCTGARGRRMLAIGHSAGGHLTGDADGDRLAARSACRRGWCRRGCRSRASSSWSRCCRPPSRPPLQPERRRTRTRPVPCPAAAARRCPLHAVVGGAESSEFIRQSRDFAAAWGGSWEALPGANHFTVLAPLSRSGQRTRGARRGHGNACRRHDRSSLNYSDRGDAGRS